MPSRRSEALILQTYPFGEADVVVSAFTRDLGKVRGVAKGVRRPKSRFGAGLERLAHVRLFYYERENRDLCRLDRAELVGPPVFLRADYSGVAALDYLAEVSDQLLPEHAPNDAHFRLIVLALEYLWDGMLGKLDGQAVWTRPATPAALHLDDESTIVTPSAPPYSETAASAQRPWMWVALGYVSLWSLRLSGFLPPLDRCHESGEAFAPGETVYFGRPLGGLVRAAHRDANSWALSPAARAAAQTMLKRKLPDIDATQWDARGLSALLRFAVQRIEAQLDSRLRTSAALEALAPA